MSHGNPTALLSSPPTRAEAHIWTEVTGLVAEMHDKMLAVVQRLVKPHGLRTVRVHRIGMLLRGDGMPAPKAPITHHAPDLTVYDDAGWVIATVTIGPRAGHYLISLPTVDVGCQTVNADQPHAVVDMICAARGAAA